MCGENDNTFSFTHPNCLDLMDPRSARSCRVMSPGPGQGAGRRVTSGTAASEPGCRVQVGMAPGEAPEGASLARNQPTLSLSARHVEIHSRCI